MSEPTSTFPQLSTADPLLIEETSNRIGRLISTLLTPATSTRFDRAKIYALLFTFVLVWCGFLALLTTVHYDQTETYAGISYRARWFDPFDGFLITLPLILPGIVLLLSVFIVAMQERYRRESAALLRALRLRDEALTPVTDMHWPPHTQSESTHFAGISMVGWETANRTYLLIRLGSRFFFFC